MADPEQKTDWEAVARDVVGETERLERLVEDLLLLAHAEERQPHRRPVELKKLVKNVTERLRDPRILLDAESVSVLGDPEQLAKAIANLVDNARRHAKQRIKVTLKGDNESAYLSVDDDGPGVPPSERERIFDRFTRLDEARAREAGGLDIGLALAARIFAGHEGTVACLDSELGGARFEARLPAVSQAGKSDR